jgi:hypothetical protein
VRNIDSLISKTLSVGLVADVDFSESDTGAEMIGFDASRSLAYYYDTELSSYIGTGILSGPAYSFAYLPNPFNAKVGLSDTTKDNVMTSGQISPPPSKRGDYAHIMALAPQALSGSQSLEFVTVIIWAESESELLQRFDAAYNKYNAPTDSEDDGDAIVPYAFSLSQNYPNPFNPQTTIQFSIDRGQQVSLSVYNVLGRRVKTLVDRSLEAGNHEVVWDGFDDFGNSVASGIYFYRLNTSIGHVSRKMMLLK